MNYIDCDKLVLKENETLNHLLICLICSGLLIDPIECIQCQRGFCKACIKKLDIIKCSVCKYEKFTKPHIQTKYLLDNITFRTDCCDSLINYSEQNNHIKICPNYYKCDNKQCERYFYKDEYIQHKDICPFKIIKCPLCQIDIKLSEYNYHEKIVCDYFLNRRKLKENLNISVTRFEIIRENTTEEKITYLDLDNNLNSRDIIIGIDNSTRCYYCNKKFQFNCYKCNRNFCFNCKDKNDSLMMFGCFTFFFYPCNYLNCKKRRRKENELSIFFPLFKIASNSRSYNKDQKLFVMFYIFFGWMIDILLFFFILIFYIVPIIMLFIIIYIFNFIAIVIPYYILFVPIYHFVWKFMLNKKRKCKNC